AARRPRPSASSGGSIRRSRSARGASSSGSSWRIYRRSRRRSRKTDGGISVWTEHPEALMSTIRLGLRENLPQFSLLVLINAFVGANQAMAWSMTVIMKVDLVGPKRRGLALGLNEFAGYVAVGVMSWVTGYIASQYALRPQPFYLGIAVAFLGLFLSVAFVRETRGHTVVEAATVQRQSSDQPPSLGRIFYVTSLGNAALFA